MHAVFSQNHFLIKEQVGLFSAENNYDVYTPPSERIVLECREQNLSRLSRFVRFAIYRRTPFDIQLRTPEGEPVLRVQRPTVLRPRVTVRDAKGQFLGEFRQRFVALVEKYDILDQAQEPQYLLERSLRGREFRFLQAEKELARITKKWAGFGRELFTSADTYELSITEEVQADDPVRMLMLGAVVTIDMLLFE